eukprot:TRINITY_DN6887_c1_g2_i1.p1 TRINITY_DN6887_c1_g2~~TRINITY_DN6887_c1_g2_i1.p1  ORF type:complete len:476 (+),score=65.48 TRINITY_DN6887_c1_g2_i1:155-1582(+)
MTEGEVRDDLFDVFLEYVNFGSYTRDVVLMDGTRFARLIRQLVLVDNNSRVALHDADVAFHQTVRKGAGGQRMTYEQFIDALALLAPIAFPHLHPEQGLDALIDSIVYVYLSSKHRATLRGGAPSPGGRAEREFWRQEDVIREADALEHKERERKARRTVRGGRVGAGRPLPHPAAANEERLEAEAFCSPYRGLPVHNTAPPVRHFDDVEGASPGEAPRAPYPPSAPQAPPAFPFPHPAASPFIPPARPFGVPGDAASLLTEDTEGGSASGFSQGPPPPWPSGFGSPAVPAPWPGGHALPLPMPLMGGSMLLPPPFLPPGMPPPPRAPPPPPSTVQPYTPSQQCRSVSFTVPESSPVGARPTAAAAERASAPQRAASPTTPGASRATHSWPMEDNASPATPRSYAVPRPGYHTAHTSVPSFRIHPNSGRRALVESARHGEAVQEGMQRLMGMVREGRRSAPRGAARKQASRASHP